MIKTENKSILEKEIIKNEKNIINNLIENISISENQNGNISRGKIYDLINDTKSKHKWTFVVKALLNSTTKNVSTFYIKAKLIFCRDNLESSEHFLSFDNMRIYTAIKLKYDERIK